MVAGQRDYSWWAYALVEAGDGQSAISAGREAVARYPDDTDLQYDLARAYLKEDRFTEAHSTIDRAIALDAEEPAYRELRADIMLQLERFEEAIQDAQVVIDAEPNSWRSFEQIIDALVALGRVADAASCAKDLVQLTPAEPGALRVASRFHLSQGRLDSALELVDRALDINANAHQARLLRGCILFKMEEHRRASEDLRQVASHHPHSVPVHCWLADSLLLSGNFEEAIDAAEHLIEIDPTHFHAHCVRGLALIKLGRPAEAIAILDELLPTDDSHSLLVAASRVRGIGDYEAASRYLHRVAQLQPDNRDLWIERTRLHLDEGAFDAAAESAARIEALPDGSLLGRLLSTQAAAATEPLAVALDTLGAILESEDFKSDERLHLEAAAGILTVSVRNFGPRYLAQGLVKLRNLLTPLLHEGVAGRILTDFLKENLDGGFAGSLADWEEALESLAASLADLPDCRIPVEMLDVAVRYTKTGDERHLLSLPLEQRQLLEDILPQAAGEHAVPNLSGSSHLPTGLTAPGPMYRVRPPSTCRASSRELQGSIALTGASIAISMNCLSNVSMTSHRAAAPRCSASAKSMPFSARSRASASRTGLSTDTFGSPEKERRAAATSFPAKP